MSEAEIKELIDKLNAGLLEAQKQMLKEKALHDQDIVVADAEGGVLHIPAKQVPEAHPELRE